MKASVSDPESTLGAPLTLSLEIAGVPADDILAALTDIPNVIQVEQTGASTDDTATFCLHYTPTTDI